MSPRLRAIGLCALLFVFVWSANLAFAQSQWKEIPVGYNMPKAVMAAAPSAPAPAPFPKAPRSDYRGQGRDPHPSWELELHGGGFFPTDSSQGTAGVFDPGTAFNTFNAGDPSLQVSSYMFGPGAALTQQYGAAFGNPGVISLDPVAHSQVGKLNSGASVGFRISRDLTSRFNLEFNADWAAAPISITDRAILGIEDTGNSFFNFFLGTPIGALPAGAPPNHLLVLADLKRSTSSQLFWTAAVNVNLKTSGKNIPYLTFGGGGVSRLGPAPHVSLLGYYDFDGIAGPHAETDVVNLTSLNSRTQWVAVLGIGYKYYATRHWGIRFDVRDHFMENTLNTRLDATPNVATLGPSDVIEGFPGNNPDLQFSNDPATAPSSLSGPAIRGRHTFRGDGWVNQVNASGGVFYRF